MAKLIDDPKVAALVEKETAKAVKEANKAFLAAIKDAIATAKEAGDKAGATALRVLATTVKAA